MNSKTSRNTTNDATNTQQTASSQPTAKRSNRGRPRDPERLKRIIESATHSFLEHGFVGTSMEAVAQASGVSKMTIYSYFPSKEILFENCASKRTDQVFAFLDASPDQGKRHPEQALRQLAVEFVALMRDPQVLSMHQVLIASQGQHLSVNQGFFQQGPLRLTQRVTEYFHMLSDLGQIELDSPHRAANQFLSLFLGTPHLRGLLSLGSPSAAEDQQMIDDNLRMFFRAYPLKIEE